MSKVLLDLLAFREIRRDLHFKQNALADKTENADNRDSNLKQPLQKLKNKKVDFAVDFAVKNISKH